MPRIRVALSGIYYPVAILRYFEEALRNHPDVDLITVGIGTGSWIPWNNGMTLPEKYAKDPDISFHKNLWRNGKISPAILYTDSRVEDIDIWIQCDAGFYFTDRPPCKKLVHIATDPHVLDYTEQRRMADHFFNMQRWYSKPGDEYLPYAASQYHHFPVRELQENPQYDVAIVGLNYPVRDGLARRLRAEGIKVLHTMGLGMDEYREANNSAKIMVSWSSLNDLIARVFEAGAMRIPLVTNHVPDLAEHFYDGEDLLVFRSQDEAVTQVKRLLADENFRRDISWSQHNKVVLTHFYDHRINQILEKVTHG